MSQFNWMLYGAYGYTGKLIAEEAVRRSHKPVLAGRSGDQLAPLAEEMGLRYKVIGLDDSEALIAALRGVRF